MDILTEIAKQTWLMIAEMSPYLLIGFAISALLHRYLKQAWIERLMGRQNLSSIVWGSVVGVPMPLCSCGVIPVTMSLHAKGASKGASVSFLTSTPQTGVDSFLATYGMLGPVFALYKLIVAFVSGILVGLATDFFERRSKPQPSTRANVTQQSAATPSLPQSLRYGFYTMPGDLSNALLIGFVLAGLVAALAPANLLSDLPGGALSAILLATLVSVPFYICSTGSIPLALALVHSGLPISAALVLLIAGPATNIATITAMRKVLGGRSTLIYVAGVVLTAWIAAAAYHLFLDNGTLGTAHHSHGNNLEWWKHASGIALILMLIMPKLPLGRPGTPANPSTNNSQTMKYTLSIEGMNCSHCENSVRNGLASLPATEVLAVDKNSQTATIQTETFSEAAIAEKISSLGFDFKGLK